MEGGRSRVDLSLTTRSRPQGDRTLCPIRHRYHKTLPTLRLHTDLSIRASYRPRPYLPVFPPLFVLSSRRFRSPL
jgi:hypothetical protein